MFSVRIRFVFLTSTYRSSCAGLPRASMMTVVSQNLTAEFVGLHHGLPGQARQRRAERTTYQLRRRRVWRRLGILQLQKLLRIPRKNRILLCLRYLQRVHGGDGVAHQPPALLGIERRIGREHPFVGAAEGMAAARPRDVAERRVGI